VKTTFPSKIPRVDVAEASVFARKRKREKREEMGKKK